MYGNYIKMFDPDSQDVSLCFLFLCVRGSVPALILSISMAKVVLY